MTTAVAGVSLGGRVRELRTRLSPTLTQVELSRRVGAEDGYVGGVENGKIALPSADILRRLARELGTTVADLLNAAGYLPDGELVELGAGVEDPALSLMLRRAGAVEDERLREMLVGLIGKLLEYERRDDEA